MNVEILVAVITGLFSLLGIILTCVSSNRKIEKKLEVSQAVTDTKIENLTKRIEQSVTQKLEISQAVTNTKLEDLTREVRKHNGFAERMPVVENEIKHIEDDIHTLKGYHEHE